MLMRKLLATVFVLLLSVVAVYAANNTIEVRNNGASTASRTATFERATWEPTDINMSVGDSTASKSVSTSPDPVYRAFKVSETSIASSEVTATGTLYFFWDADGATPGIALLYLDATGTKWIASFPSNFNVAP